MNEPEATVLIAGAGIGGLCLALALRKHCGLAAGEIEVFEQSRSFNDNAGGAVGLYANGLRVLRDISPELLAAVRKAGYPYECRRWFRHDGTQVACARESELCDEPDLQSIGIRRWKLQKVLCDAAADAGIVVSFKMRAESVVKRADDRVEVTFKDGSTRVARLVFGADGLKSKVREAVVGQLAADFTGVTCLMGAAHVPTRIGRGISFPSSRTTKNHGCFYPTGDDEQIFQLYFPAKEVDDAWGTLTAEEGRLECAQLAERLRADGWDEKFLVPLENAEAVIRVGLFAREPLDVWVGGGGRIILLGDAAHPPVPYIGQGAMMAMEDVGVLTRLLKIYCCADGARPFDPSDHLLARVSEAYQQLRIPRVTPVLRSSHQLGKTQQRRAESWWYNLCREWEIWLNVCRHGTLPIMKPGAAYDFRVHVDKYVHDKDKGDASGGGNGDEVAVVDEGGGRARAAVGLLTAAAAAATVALIVARRR